MKTEQEKLNYINKECNTNYTFLDDVDWYDISKNYNISEDFIREFQDKVKWDSISANQKLSEEFKKRI